MLYMLFEALQRRLTRQSERIAAAAGEEAIGAERGRWGGSGRRRIGGRGASARGARGGHPLAGRYSRAQEAFDFC